MQSPADTCIHYHNSTLIFTVSYCHSQRLELSGFIPRLKTTVCVDPVSNRFKEKVSFTLEKRHIKF